MSKKLDYNATVAERIEINSGLIILRVVPDGELFDFKPGQYTVLGVKQTKPWIPSTSPKNSDGSKDPEKLIRHAYSIASSSLEKKYADFYMNLVEDGELTPRLFNLKVGDRLFLGTKTAGLFTVDQVPPHKHLLLIATGTGIAPYISMVRTLLTSDGNRLFVVVHGVRYSRDLGYRDELTSLSQIHPNLEYFPTVSRSNEDPDWSGLKGRVQNIIQSGVIEEQIGMKITPESFDVFLCGNPDMIRDVISVMEKRGFQTGDRKNPGTIHIEEYW